MAKTPPKALGPELVREQDRRLKELNLSALQILGVPRNQRRYAPRVEGRTLGVLVGTGVLALLAGALWVRFPRTDYRVLPDTAAAGAESFFGDGAIGRWIAAQSTETKTLAFNDGTRAHLRPGARLRVLDLSRRGGSLVLETGALELQVRGTKITEYRVSAGPFHLTIPKGRVTATWNPMTMQLDLVVHEGFAVIAGCQFVDGRSVMAGRELGARCSEP